MTRFVTYPCLLLTNLRLKKARFLKTSEVGCLLSQLVLWHVFNKWFLFPPSSSSPSVKHYCNNEKYFSNTRTDMEFRIVGELYYTIFDRMFCTLP